jgi:hypothetical protein
VAVTSELSRNDYIGNDSTTTFPYNFRIFAPTDVRVVVRSAISGAETVKTYSLDYTVSGVGNVQGGLVDFFTAPASGDVVTLVRRLGLTQPLSLAEQGSYSPSDVERAIDRIAMQVQQLEDEVARSFKARETYHPVALTLSVSPETGKVLGWASASRLTNFAAPVSTGVTLPGEGRTAPTLTAYLLHNAVFNVKDFGALGNNSTDDTAAFNRAFAAANPKAEHGRGAGYGGTVFVPPGHYLVSSMLSLPPQTIMVGCGRENTTVMAHSSFTFSNRRSGNVALVKLNGFGCRVENMHLNCAHKANSVAVYSDSINEQSGLFHCLLGHFKKYGLWISNNPPRPMPPQNYGLWGLEVYWSDDATNVTGVFLDAAPPRTMGWITTNNAGGGETVPGNSVGFRFESMQFGARDLHPEHCTTAILWGTTGACTGSRLDNISLGPACTNGIVAGSASGGMQAFAVSNLSNRGCSGHLLNDVERGLTIPGAVTGAIERYAVGTGSNPPVSTTDATLLQARRTLDPTSATPTVKGLFLEGTDYKVGESATAITEILGADNGRTIRLFFTGNRTVRHARGIYLKGLADFNGVNGSTLLLHRRDGWWQM